MEGAEDEAVEAATEAADVAEAVEAAAATDDPVGDGAAMGRRSDCGRRCRDGRRRGRAAAGEAPVARCPSRPTSPCTARVGRGIRRRHRAPLRQRRRAFID
ncbi:MAG: hypothetical protein ACLTDR_04490 [Adlercreutzia equolifaciens]